MYPLISNYSNTPNTLLLILNGAFGVSLGWVFKKRHSSVLHRTLKRRCQDVILTSGFGLK